jgi:uncharacterized protein (TIGR03546 family)
MPLLLLKWISNIIGILRSGHKPGEIAAASVLGMFLGLSSLWTPHGIVIALILALVNVNLAMATLSALIFAGLAYVMDPVLHSLGYFLLVTAAPLHGFWTWVVNTPILALGRYNNTVVTGSLAAAVLLSVPLYYLIKMLVVHYRTHLDSRFEKWKIIKALKSNTIVTWYQRVKKLGE